MDGYIKTDRPFGTGLVLALTLAIFFVGFNIFYTPFEVSSYFNTGEDFKHSFHLLMTGAIIFASTLLVRIFYHLFYAGRRTLWWRYAMWCLMEVSISALFAALYTWLFKRPLVDYFGAFGYCFKIIFCTLVFPYTFHVLYRIVRDGEERIEEMQNRSRDTGENVLVKLNDEHGRLKLAIDSGEILFLKAEINYVKIFYLEAGEIKDFSLRNSMKNVEAAVSEHGIVRCHRSYLVNPGHIKVLRKDKYGFVVAELNISGIKPIPISKTYYEAITGLL